MIKGWLHFEIEDASRVAGEVHLILEDARRVGSDAIEIARTVIAIPQDFDLSTEALPFEWEVPSIGAGLTLRAHMRNHDDTDVRSGDLISMVSYLVAKEEEMAVTLKQVN